MLPTRTADADHVGAGHHDAVPLQNQDGDGDCLVRPLDAIGADEVHLLDAGLVLGAADCLTSHLLAFDAVIKVGLAHNSIEATHHESQRVFANVLDLSMRISRQSLGSRGNVYIAFCCSKFRLQQHDSLIEVRR